MADKLRLVALGVPTQQAEELARQIDQSGGGGDGQALTIAQRADNATIVSLYVEDGVLYAVRNDGGVFEVELPAGGTNPPEPGPLTMVTPPTATPFSAAVGDNVSFSLGSYSNAVSVVGVLTQLSTDRTAELTDFVWSPSTAGAWRWVVTATGIDGSQIQNEVDGTIAAASAGVEAVSYFYIDQDTPYTGTAAGVTGLTAEGTGGLSLVIGGAGSPNLVTHETGANGGLRFNVGRYLTITGISPSTAAGTILLVDVTFDTLTGTAQALTFMGSGGSAAQLRRSSASYQSVSVTAGTVTDGPATVGRRVVMAVEIDAVAGVGRSRNTETGAILATEGTADPLAPVSLTIGQGMAGVLHRAAVILRPAGQQLPITLDQAIADFTGSGGGTVPIEPGASIMGIDGIDQSLGLGPNEGGNFAPNGQRWRDALNGGEGVVMLAGMQRADGVAITQVAAPLLQGYNLTIAPTGIAPAVATGNVPGGLILALALQRDGVITDTVSYRFNGAGGQQIANFDNDPLTGSGSVLLYQNSEVTIGRSVEFFGASNSDYTIPYFLMNQGEADRLLPRGEYTIRARQAINERMAQITRLTGQTPPPIFIHQTGGYCRKQDNAFMVLDQIDLIREYNMTLIGPNWQVPVADAIVHPGINEHVYMYELAAWAIAEREAGRSWNLLPPVSVTRSGDTITIPISVRTDETLTTQPGKYAQYGGDPVNLGLEVDGGGSITSASVSGGNIVLQVSGAVTGVRHAHQRAAGIDYGTMPGPDGKCYVAHRSLIRTTLTKPMTSFGGLDLTLQRWVPSFEVLVT